MIRLDFEAGQWKCRVMTVAIGPVLLVVSSFLLGAVLVIGGFGIILWLGVHYRRVKNRTAKRIWGHAPDVIADRNGVPVVVPPK